ncbi:MAG: PIG-L deacetylase family protein [Planctomycetota bacterium]
MARKKTAFAIASHPDDIEFLMAGTLVLLKEAGYEIHYMNIANGSCGTNQYDTETIIAMRRAESREACEVIGAHFHESLANDLEVFYTLETLRKLTAVVRDVKPEIVLTHSPEDYMEDHQNAGRLAVSATFCRGMPNFRVDPARPVTGQDVCVYHAQPYGNRDPLRRLVEPEIYVDIAETVDAKAEMLCRHRSQKDWLDSSQGQDSYIITMKELSAEVGRMSGRFEFAEGWRRQAHMGFGPESFDPLSKALKGRAFTNQAYLDSLGSV